VTPLGDPADRETVPAVLSNRGIVVPSSTNKENADVLVSTLFTLSFVASKVRYAPALKMLFVPASRIISSVKVPFCATVAEAGVNFRKAPCPVGGTAVIPTNVVILSEYLIASAAPTPITIIRAAAVIVVPFFHCIGFFVGVVGTIEVFSSFMFLF
jgi:hypothetical protein